MPRTYDHAGVRFQYPDNWHLDESAEGDDQSQELAESQTVSVSSPGGAFWTVVRHDANVEPTEAVETSLRAMRDIYPDLDAETAEEDIAQHTLRGYDLNFICLDLTNTTLIRGFRTANASYLILCQADDREFEQVKLVFQAITTSLMQGLTPQLEASWPPKRMFPR